MSIVSFLLFIFYDRRTGFKDLAAVSSKVKYHFSFATYEYLEIRLFLTFFGGVLLSLEVSWVVV